MASSSNKHEHHEKHFRGTWAHASLHEAVESGRLPALAAWLAMTIDAYSKNEREGCFASNSYLGKKMGNKSERQIQRLLCQLEDHGFLRSRWQGKMRCLSIDWKGKSNSARLHQYHANDKTIVKAANSKSNSTDQKRVRHIVRHDKNVVSDTTKMSCRY